MRYDPYITIMNDCNCFAGALVYLSRTLAVFASRFRDITDMQTERIMNSAYRTVLFFYAESTFDKMSVWDWACARVSSTRVSSSRVETYSANLRQEKIYQDLLRVEALLLIVWDGYEIDDAWPDQVIQVHNSAIDTIEFLHAMEE